MIFNRREFVAASIVGLTLGQHSEGADKNPMIPIVDTHTHFYDPTRPEGVPWPGKGDSLLYRPVLPAEFKTLTKPFGVIGTVIIEASGWLEDNQWLLDLAAKDPFVLGIVGNLSPGKDGFTRHLKRFSQNPLYRGIRLDSETVKQGLDRPEFVADLKHMIDADLELDINGGPDMLPVVAALATRLPQLRIVINHLANLPIDGKQPSAEWVSGLNAAARHPQVYLKVSALVESARTDGKLAPTDVGYYRPILQACWNAFGVDRQIFGSDWPVSDVGGPYPLVVKIVTEYFQDHGLEAQQKFFAKNARAAYRWPDRA